MGKLGIYLVADYPSRRTFLGAVAACRDLCIDFLEVGFPFSDPVADGEVIEEASRRVLERSTLDTVIAGFREARSIFAGPVYVMTYANMVYSGGASRFIEKVSPLSGLILADLPLREVPFFERTMGRTDAALIRFLTPESRPEDIETALRGARGFIYFVSKRGTTGGGFELDGPTREKIGRVRGRGVDVYVGFGIRDRRDVELAFEVADGAIVGTRAVSALASGVGAFRELVASLKGVKP